MKTLVIRRPDDWHVHFRDHAVLQHSVLATAQHFARALVMPNLQPALCSITAINAYRERILAVVDNKAAFTPYMTFYLNETVSSDELAKAKEYPYILGAKLYPAGATTNSAEGAHSIKALYPLLDVMQEKNLVLQIHGEVTQGDIFERETLFVETELRPLVRNFPKLRIVLEHISSRSAVDFVLQAPATVAATITAHHLLYNRNHLLAGGMRPHYYCLPILKSEADQKAIQAAAISGNPRFFAGTDSAPHARTAKESACACAGIYSAPYALAIYAQVFDSLDRKERLNAFMSQYGADFYQLPLNTGEITLLQQTQSIPLKQPWGEEQIVPVGAGTQLAWTIHESDNDHN
jgi:dihydroorotase